MNKRLWEEGKKKNNNYEGANEWRWRWEVMLKKGRMMEGPRAWEWCGP